MLNPMAPATLPPHTKICADQLGKIRDLLLHIGNTIQIKNIEHFECRSFFLFLKNGIIITCVHL